MVDPVRVVDSQQVPALVRVISHMIVSIVLAVVGPTRRLRVTDVSPVSLAALLQPPGAAQPLVA